MTARNDGQLPAYPTSVELYGGLTRREAFAMAAMQGMLAAGGSWPDARDCAEIARRSVVQADALLAELSK